jgi:phosphoglycolate phosphatase-like HAD superfamily hydrolase
MHLVLFDIDGTLTHTCAADADCFVRAVCESLNLPGVDADWSRYRHVTDSGIFGEIAAAALGRAAEDDEHARTRDHFVGLLRAAFAADPSLCRPVPGAPAMLADLIARPDVAVALATGGWEPSARLKLATAGLPADGLPFASASDSQSREEIMLIAKSRAAARHGVAEFETFTYVGDAPWDVRACRKLGVPLIAVAQGDRAEQLRADGARHVLPDFLDHARFLELLTRARRDFASP